MDPAILEAAVALGATLTRLGYAYAVVGGAACTLYGSSRSTIDLDLVVDVSGDGVRALKEKVASADPLFQSVGNSLYYREHRFPIELIPSGAFTWPSPLSSGSQDVVVVGGAVRVLSPAAIVFAKSGRAASSLGSTRPRTITKFRSDLADMEFLSQQIGSDDLAAVLKLYAPEKQLRLRDNLSKLGEVSSNIRKLYDGLAAV